MTCDNWLGVIRSCETFGNMYVKVEIHKESRYSLILWIRNGILHFVNQTPFELYVKKQSTVETATYGSEMVAARTAVEHIIENRKVLRCLGVEVKQISYSKRRKLFLRSEFKHSRSHRLCYPELFHSAFTS